MANPRLQSYPSLNMKSSTFRVTPNQIYDYDYELRNAVAMLNGDPRLRAPDRKLVLSFLEHIKAQKVSTGRLAKYVNMLRTASLTLRVLWRRAKRRDIEDLMVKLADHEIVNVRAKEERHYSAETMADFHMIVKRFQRMEVGPSTQQFQRTLATSGIRPTSSMLLRSHQTLNC
jgi:hypothetical protein